MLYQEISTIRDSAQKMTNRYKYCFLVLICFCIGNVTVNGQQVNNVVIQGVVIDAKTDYPIPLAGVAINGTTRIISTDSEGKFFLATTGLSTILRVGITNLVGTQC